MKRNIGFFMVSKGNHFKIIDFHFFYIFFQLFNRTGIKSIVFIISSSLPIKSVALIGVFSFTITSSPETWLITSFKYSPLIKNNFQTKNAIKTIKKIESACINVGFFQVTGHGLSLKDVQKICEIGNKFFNLSDNNKKKIIAKKME